MRLLILGAMLFCAPFARAGGVAFHEGGHEDAHREAGQSGKIVMTEFFATWCHSCKRLNNTTFRDDRVVDWLKNNAVPIKIDGEKHRGLHDRFNVVSYPTLVFTQADGSEFFRIRGAPTAEVFLDAVNAALKRVQVAKAPAAPSPRQEVGERIQRALTQYRSNVGSASESNTADLDLTIARQRLLTECAPYYEALMKAGQSDQAESLAQSLLQVDQSAETYHSLALAGLRSGAANARTMAHAGQALKRSGGSDARIVDTAARVLASRGFITEARSMLEKTLQRTDDIESRSILEGCLTELKDTQ